MFVKRDIEGSAAELAISLSTLYHPYHFTIPDRTIVSPCLRGSGRRIKYLMLTEDISIQSACSQISN